MPTVENVLFSLGTNIGDRQENIKKALELLDSRLGSHWTALSPIIETEAVGFAGPAFLNCVVRYATCLSPVTLLSICKDIEKEMGRCDDVEWDAEGRRVYHDRIIDIDILCYGTKTIHTRSLTIPHPQIETRPFIKELIACI